MRIAACLVAGLVASTVYASEPGQPLDCSDWVFVEPGFNCSNWVQHGCASVNASSPFCEAQQANAVFDNEGRQYAMRIIPDGALCCTSVGACNACPRFALVRFDGLVESVVARLDARFNGSAGIDSIVEGNPLQLAFDSARGRLLIWLTSGSNEALYPQTKWVAAINGFASMYDVLQTFTPTANALGFRVPYMPEGMPAADHFDTCYGPLTHPIDFSLAQGLACSYPTAVPVVGDYLKVADTLPDPAPGTGRYYVTAATYQGQTRYGRKTTNRVMSGRDPAGLPGCAAR